MFQQTGERAQRAPTAEGSSVLSISKLAIEQLRVVDGLATAEVSRTCVLLWRSVVTDSRFRVQREAMLHVASRHPGDAAILCIIEPAAEPPPQPLREAAAALLQQLGPQLRCVAYVIEGNGFRAAMIRGVLSSIELVRRSAYPARYFATVPEAASWIAAETGRRSGELIDASHMLRQRLGELD